MKEQNSVNCGYTVKLRSSFFFHKAIFFSKFQRCYKKFKFKTTDARHVEVKRTAMIQKLKSQKGITSTKKKDLLMLCKKGLIPC